jgi:hypothetical protein
MRYFGFWRSAASAHLSLDPLGLRRLGGPQQQQAIGRGHRRFDASQAIARAQLEHVFPHPDPAVLEALAQPLRLGLVGGRVGEKELHGQASSRDRNDAPIDP